ncbi:MAG: DegT/DnrJ/EryC1/StrS family aminotransferase [Candidatus Electrothrix aestuarii]|uniref:GDP-perosamine synthase n=1 Tax=Candidatus Electrothrix aestuarii TaxID=3062594 RepID=A0AAU8LZA0_9BACT|nr:DegT/DnrJ/EryC1/StrS family aminotransferase [Candidatus Electrothrix aestuarii]
MRNKRIFLSAPHMGGQELDFIQEAFASNYIAPVGPQLDAFEQEFAEKVGAKYAAAVTSGTAALHLLLRYAGVGLGDTVLCSTFTFAASANPILYQGAIPVFIDSDHSSWNMDPALLASELERRANQNTLPKAVVLVHLYGQPADIDPIKAACDKYGVLLIEDAAEALGAKYKGKVPGTFGLAGFYSFNGNKIITTSGGGMIVSDDEALIRKVKFWATQARDNAVHYQHTEMGYNYRMSNVLAAIGRGQLQVLNDRVQRKREIFASYQAQLVDLPGLAFMPEPDFARSTRWLTCLTINPEQAGINRDTIIQELENNNIESRPTWKPMHMQPLYADCNVVGGQVAEEIFRNGLCLPSGTGMHDEDLKRIVHIIRTCWQ